MLHIDNNLLEIDSSIDEIVAELLKSDEVMLYRKARENFLKDEKLQNKIAVLQQNIDFIPFRSDLRELQREINLNEKVYQLKLAENDLQEILSNLTKAITYSISKNIPIDENLPLRGGGHHQRRRAK
ncbi:MAG: YlbF family regulator [Streptococcaceae bacterium]|nr:YlbF family regulator [Streptococcaceae bacterium]